MITLHNFGEVEIDSFLELTAWNLLDVILLFPGYPFLRKVVLDIQLSPTFAARELSVQRLKKAFLARLPRLHIANLLSVKVS